jgi:hypothetical protein
MRVAAQCNPPAWQAEGSAARPSGVQRKVKELDTRFGRGLFLSLTYWGSPFA